MKAILPLLLLSLLLVPIVYTAKVPLQDITHITFRPGDLAVYSTHITPRMTCVSGKACRDKTLTSVTCIRQDPKWKCDAIFSTSRNRLIFHGGVVCDITDGMTDIESCILHYTLNYEESPAFIGCLLFALLCLALAVSDRLYTQNVTM